MTNETAIHNLFALKLRTKVLSDKEALGMAIKALEQQPSEDKEVIQVSKGTLKARQGRFVIYDVEWLKEHFFTTEAKIYGQPQQPSEDCVSREAVMKCFKKWQPYMATRLWDYEQELKDLPSVTPERPKGKWIHWTDDYKDYCTCSECGYGEEGEVLLKDKTPYCPYCGAEMEEDSE